MPNYKEEDIHKVLRGLMSILDLREVLKNHQDCDSCEEDDDDEDLEEIKIEHERVKKIHDEYEEMFKWAFGQVAESMTKEKMCKRWARLHPDLPAMFMPYKVNNDVANLILLMQLIPHWHEFKKKNKD